MENIAHLIRNYLITNGFNEEQIYTDFQPSQECIVIHNYQGLEPDNFRYPHIQIVTKFKKENGIDKSWNTIVEIYNLLHNKQSIQLGNTFFRYIRAKHDPLIFSKEEDGSFLYFINFRLMTD